MGDVSIMYVRVWNSSRLKKIEEEEDVVVSR